MITVIPGDGIVQYHGLEAKIGEVDTDQIRNGSIYIAIDTSTTYMFNEEAKSWVKYTGGSINMFATSNEKAYMFSGLSTDTKPANRFVGDGSVFIEMDTSKTYMFSAATKTWYPFNGCGGGGGGSSVSAVLTAALQAGLSVGGVTAGQTFPKGTPIEDVIKAILAGIVPTPEEGKLYWGTLDETPTQITAALTEEEIPANITSTGIKHRFTTQGTKLQYGCFIYPSDLGNLAHIYENGLSIDLLENFVKTTITNEGTTYNLYYYQDPVKLINDEFEFKWN